MTRIRRDLRMLSGATAIANQFSLAEQPTRQLKSNWAVKTRYSLVWRKCYLPLLDNAHHWFLNYLGSIDKNQVPVLFPHQHQPQSSLAEMCPRGILGLADFPEYLVGWIGMAHDVRIFRSSGLFSTIRNGTFVPVIFLGHWWYCHSPIFLGNLVYASSWLPLYLLLDTWAEKDAVNDSGMCLWKT